MRVIMDGEKGGEGTYQGVWMLGKREIIYLSLHCIKMGSGEMFH